MKPPKGESVRRGEARLDQLTREAALETQLEERLQDTQRRERAAKQLMRRAAMEDRIVGEVRTALADAVGAGRWKSSCSACPLAHPMEIAKSSRCQEEAVLVISDPHVGKETELRNTLGFGFYNPRIFLDRLAHLEATVLRLIRENVANPIARLHLLFLGDLVEGGLDHAEEIPNRALIVNQVLLADIAFYHLISRLSQVLPITVRGVVGNHGRWQNQRKPPTGGRWSNFDFIVMGALEQLCSVAGLANVEFHLPEAAFDVWDIGQWRFKIGHGDYLKGGDRALGVPAHAIARDINATTQRYAARQERVPDYYIVGDKHRHVSVTTAKGRYLINGAWFEADEYALASNFSPGRPHQMFFGVHPRKGRSWAYDLWLDDAPPLKTPSCALPPRLLDHVMSYPNVDPSRAQ